MESFCLCMYFGYNCQPYIFLISMKSFACLWCPFSNSRRNLRCLVATLPPWWCFQAKWAPLLASEVNGNKSLCRDGMKTRWGSNVITWLGAGLYIIYPVHDYDSVHAYMCILQRCEGLVQSLLLNVWDCPIVCIIELICRLCMHVCMAIIVVALYNVVVQLVVCSGVHCIMSQSVAHSPL